MADYIEGMDEIGELDNAIQGLLDDVSGMKDDVGALGDTEIGDVADPEIGATGNPIARRRKLRQAKSTSGQVSAVNARLSKVETALKSLQRLQQRVVKSAKQSVVSDAGMMIYQNSQTGGGSAGTTALSFTATQLDNKFGWVGFFSASAATIVITKVGASPVTDPGGSVQIKAGEFRWIKMSPRPLTSGTSAQISFTSTAASQVLEMYAVPPCVDPELYVRGSVNS